MRKKDQYADDDYFHYHFEVPYFITPKNGDDYECNPDDMIEEAFNKASIENSFKEFDIVKAIIHSFEDYFFIVDIFTNDKLDNDQIKELTSFLKGECLEGFGVFPNLENDEIKISWDNKKFKIKCIDEFKPSYMEDQEEDEDLYEGYHYTDDEDNW